MNLPSLTQQPTKSYWIATSEKRIGTAGGGWGGVCHKGGAGLYFRVYALVWELLVVEGRQASQPSPVPISSTRIDMDAKGGVIVSLPTTNSQEHAQHQHNSLAKTQLNMGSTYLMGFGLRVI